jgi:hypothetical protein
MTMFAGELAECHQVRYLCGSTLCPGPSLHLCENYPESSRTPSRERWNTIGNDYISNTSTQDVPPQGILFCSKSRIHVIRTLKMHRLLQKCLVLCLSICAVKSRSSNRELDLDPYAIDQYANNSLFLRWRPRYHFLVPAGHMNE